MTRLLALETSGRSGSVAIAMPLPDGSLQCEQEILDPQFGSAKTLAPAIDRLLSRCNAIPNSIECIAVIQGPGSFTGLRVGVATAKTMAWALGIPIVSVDGLDVVAEQVARCQREPDLEPKRLLAVVDAYRGQMFAASYLLTRDAMEKTQATGIVDIDAVCDALSLADSIPTLVIGGGAEKLKKEFAIRHATSAHLLVQFLLDANSFPTASTVAQLGWKRWQSGETEDVWGFLPAYYRSSAAEEKAK